MSAYGYHSFVTREVCGRCGVRRDLHPLDRCKGFRVSWWWDRHYLTEHIGAWIWIHALNSKARYAVAERLRKRGRDWCGLYDCIWKADEWAEWRSDYTEGWGCLCDFPTPWQVGPPKDCYCTAGGAA